MYVFKQVRSPEFSFIYRELECTYCNMKTVSSVSSTNKTKTSPVLSIKPLKQTANSHKLLEELSIKTHLSLAGYTMRFNRQFLCLAKWQQYIPFTNAAETS